MLTTRSADSRERYRVDYRPKVVSYREDHATEETTTHPGLSAHSLRQ
jgi:hypothetical protein